MKSILSAILFAALLGAGPASASSVDFSINEPLMLDPMAVNGLFEFDNIHIGEDAILSFDRSLFGDGLITLSASGSIDVLGTIDGGNGSLALNAGSVTFGASGSIYLAGEGNRELILSANSGLVIDGVLGIGEEDVSGDGAFSFGGAIILNGPGSVELSPLGPAGDGSVGPIIDSPEIVPGTITAVPLPAALWLFPAALLALFGRRVRGFAQYSVKKDTLMAPNWVLSS